MLSYILAVLCAVLVLGTDQLTKYLVSTGFTLGEHREAVKGIIELTYIHNRGGAWGFLYGYTYILVPLTLLVMAACIFFLVKHGKKSRLLFWSVTLVLSGGLGNMIDRIFRGGNVVDFISLEFFPSFPVFNIADCAIVVGTGLLLLYFLIDSVREAKKEKENTENDG